MQRSPDASRKARREFAKPARQGGLSHVQVVCWVVASSVRSVATALSAVAQALALLDEQGDDLARQSEQHAFASGGANTPAVSAGTFSGREMRAAGHQVSRLDD